MKEIVINGKNGILLKSFNKDNLNDPQYLTWLRDYEVVKTIYREEYLTPIPFKEVVKYVEGVWAKKNFEFYAIYYNGRFVGTLKLGSIDFKTGQVDIGILVGDRKSWGKGIATNAIAAASKYCFDTLKLRKLTAGVMSNNIGMIKVFKKLGYKVEGELRKKFLFEDKFYDHILFGCFRNEFNEDFNV